jgi:predicted DsbA family dithiol-disulfide isomerase
MKVEIYSDVVCPWCYIGERRFERALSAFPRAEAVEVVFRPFQLDPNTPATAVPMKEYLEKRFGRRAEGIHGQVDGAARGEGIEFNWDRALAVNTRTAHRLLRLAEHEYGPGTQRALAGKLFALHFTDGGDLSDPGELSAAAVEAGMDRSRVEAYLASDEGVPELEAEFEAAREMGIQAVPTFVFDGKFAVQGAQSAANFLAALEEVWPADSPVETAEAGACVDGACEI